VDYANEIADGAHDNKSKPYRLAQFCEFALVWLLATVHEEGSLLEEFPREIGKFLELIGHCAWWIMDGTGISNRFPDVFSAHRL